MCPDQFQGSELPIAVVSMGGAFAPDDGMAAIDNAVWKHAPPNVTLRRGRNWAPCLGGQRIVTSADSAVIMNTIRSLSRIGDDRIALLVAGKSSGGAMAWNTFRLHYPEIARLYRRCALVLVDPHGACTGDGRIGTYCDSNPLWWPPTWSGNRNVFRVYDVFQQLHPALIPDDGLLPLSTIGDRVAETLTGAGFDESSRARLVVHEQLRDRDGLHHMNIVDHPSTVRTIRMAYRFVCQGI